MILVLNGTVLTRDEKNTVIENGAVAYEGNQIVEVGSEKVLLQKYPDAKQIDAKGGVIMPGLINAHGHIYSTLSRGLSIKNYNPVDFLDILDGQWWKIDRNLTLPDTRMSAMATYVDCIKNGVTTMFDHHASYGGIEGSLFAIADAAKQVGVRTCLCYEVSDRDGDEKMKAAVKENADFIGFCQKDDTDMVKAMMGMHASFTLSDKSLALARENTPQGVGFHIHVAEGMADVYDSLKKYNKRVLNRLFDNDILGEKTICGHCIHVTKAEIELLRDTDTMVVHNPESNMGNAVGCPPTLDMIHAGVLVGLGTDGYTNDMYESLKVANILHKHNLCDPTVAWGEAPAMLFNGNPKIGARYFKNSLGVLKAGAAADIIVSDYMPLTPLTSANTGGHSLFGLTGRSVITTIINGKTLMLNRELVAIDEERLMAKCREQAQDLWSRINA